MSLTPLPGMSRRTLLGAAVAAPVTLLTGCDRGSGRSQTPTGSASAPVTGLRFPANFRWGTATSAYQVEGAVKEDGRGQSIWDTFSHTPGRVRNGDTGDVAADHYHRYTEDLDLLKSFGIQSYRFSISWSRVLPDGRGTPNQRGIDFYRRLVDGLHQRGIAPVATLFHWDLPQMLQDAGGWENRDCAAWFADYADVVFRALGDGVPTWTTVNEPKTVVQVGYTYGAHAPGKRDPAAALVVAHHLLLAHGMAVQAYRASGGGQRIGPVLNLSPVYPAQATDVDSPAVALADARENRFYLDAILKGRYPADLFATDVIRATEPVRAAIRDGDMKIISSPVDLLGVNYYNPSFVTAAGTYVTKLPTSIATWEQIYPQGFYDILTRIKRDYGDIPISILENGIPTDDRLSGDTVHDPQRIEYLRDHIAAMHRAISDGVRVESYHLWSLLDNFEWAEGYSQRWGIVYVDVATQRRVIKDSAKWYRGVIASNGT